MSRWVVCGCHQTCTFVPKPSAGGKSVSIPTLQAWGTSRSGAVPGAFSTEMAKGHSRFEDFPRDRCLCSGCSGGLWSGWRPIWSSQLCGLRGVEQGGACTQEATAIAGEWGHDKLDISHPSLPRKGGSGRERPGGAKGNQLHESPWRPAADGQDTRRKCRFPWIRCRGQAGTSPRAQVDPKHCWVQGTCTSSKASWRRWQIFCPTPLACCAALEEVGSCTGIGLVPSSETAHLPSCILN